MLKQKLFIEQFILIAVFAVFHHLALKFYFYWTFWWFDIFMHFFGGVWIALFFVWFLFFSNFSKFIKMNINKIKNRKIFFVSILVVLVAGLLWEVFEVYANLVSVQEYGYAFDTSLDLVMDLTGGAMAFVCIKRKYLNYERG